MRARLVFLLAVVAVGTPAVARGATIADIVHAPDDWVGRSVTLVGTAERGVSVGTGAMYDLRDGRATLTVMTVAGAPDSGTRLRVTGTIERAHVGDADDNRAFPHVLVESGREPAP